MNKMADPIRVTEKGLLLVRSIMSFSECRKRHYNYEWYITLALYSFDRKATQRRFGLSNERFFRWLKRLAQRNSQNRKDAKIHKQKE